MVKYNFWHKIIVFVNSISSILLLLSYLLPFISPRTVPILTIISIAVPVLFIANVFFVIYWIIKLKKYFMISLISILLGFGYISSFYKFSENKVFLNDDVKVMSYNVRLFNHYQWSSWKGYFVGFSQKDLLTCMSSFSKIHKKN